jgi:hypothetical protein
VDDVLTAAPGRAEAVRPPGPADHSPVERAVLAALGVGTFAFTASGPRERVVSPRRRSTSR